MKPQFVAFICIAAVFGLARAESTVYVCKDENGNKEYRNTGITKGCRKVNLPGLTTVPTPQRSHATRSASAKKTSSPSSFPKVDSKTQKSRDSDRKRILQDELQAEEKKLTDLKEQYKGGEPDRLGNEKNYAKYQERVGKMKEDIARSEKNVEALKREVAGLN